MTDDRRESRLHEDLVALADQARVPPLDVLGLERRARGRVRRRQLGVLAAVLLVATPVGVGAWQASTAQDRTQVLTSGLAGAGPSQRPGPAGLPFTTLSVNGVEPTACGTDAPLSVYTAKPGAEKADTPEAAALRAVLRTGIAGMSFPPKDNWVEITRTADEVSYGHRTGAVGIDDFVSVKRTNGVWSFGGSAGCGPLGYGPTMADGIYRWAEQGNELVLSWTGGTCGYGSNGADVRTQETATEVRVVLVPRPPPPSSEDVACGGVGTDESVRVTLAAPVGNRKVVNVGFVPARNVPSQPEIDAYQAHQSAEILRGQTACDAAAATLGPGGLKTSVAYPNDGEHPITVGIIRGALKDLPAGWADLPADTAAAQCYLETPGTVQTRQIVSVVVAPGLPPHVYDRTHPVGGLFDRLGDAPG